MHKFTIMTIVKLDQKCKTVKAISTKVLPNKRKNPAATGSIQNK